MHLCVNLVIYFVVCLLNNYQCVRNTLGNSVLTAASQQASFSDAVREYEKQKAELEKAREQLTLEQKELEEEKTKMQKLIENSDVIQFNVGGEMMMTSRATLLRVVDSTLSTMLIGSTGQKFSTDKEGNIFLDYNPGLFRQLLEQLRSLESDDPLYFSAPSTTPLLVPPFNKMLQNLGLKSAPPLDNDVFTFNVGDETVATQRKTLMRVPNSKLASLVSSYNPADMDATGKPFLDFDPKLFRHLLSQLQAGKTTDFEAPSNDTKNAYNAMLKDLGLKPK